MWQKGTQAMEMTQNQAFFDGAYSNLTPNLFYQKFLKYFNDFENRNFSVLLLTWTQIMKMKQNQTFVHGAYSNLTPNHFLSKNIEVFFYQKILKYFNDFSNWSFSVLWLKTTQAMEMKQNQTFFPWDIFKSQIIFHWSQKIKYFNGFYNWHLSI